MLSLTKTHAALSAFLLLTLAASTGCGQKADLRLHLNKGDKRTVHMTQTIAIKPAAGGQSVEIGFTSEFACKFDIQDVSPTGDATAKVTFETADQNGYASMGGTTIPGMDALTGGIGKALHAIQGESFTCTLAPDGKVTNAMGMDAVAKKAADKLEIPAGPMAAMLKPTLTTQLNQALSNGAMEKLWSSAFNFYPAKPVRVNESWNVTTNTTGEGIANIPMVVVQKITFKALQTGVATLETASTITSDAGGGAAAGFKFKDVKGTEAGNIDVDVKSGWIKKGNSAATISGGIEMPAGMPGATGGASMSIEVKSVVESYDAS